MRWIEMVSSIREFGFKVSGSRPEFWRSNVDGHLAASRPPPSWKGISEDPSYRFATTGRTAK